MTEGVLAMSSKPLPIKKETINKLDEGLLLDLIRQVCRKEAGLRSCKKCPYYGKEYYCENRTDPIYYYANLIVPVYEKIKEADNGSKN